jgi:signal-transduction protein with cAMP-binding, CBS, and nucleotidyltransferase domain
MIVYGVASGKIQEFSAPGGWGAKFREAAQAAVTPTAISTPLSEVVQQFDIIQKGGLAELQGLGERLSKDKPIALSFQLKKPGYDVDVATKYIEFLLLTDRDMMVLILDESRHFVAMTEGTTMLTLLKNQGSQITNALTGNNKTFFVNLPGFHTNSIRATDSNATALEKMRQQNARAIVVVDDQGTPTGVVKRDDVVSRLLEKLATPDK